ncbi:SH3 domain-binding protein 5-like isoform X2 [Panonychus citri]|uniref:SH3 domain-binding protein 5-like isoform X2 n=1 Tax=Panonychus citri TaxID=50023 RepID=UPI00230819C8|nr:SH3 domain-binding protein 5-like isoform X2 [Panonychus citri]
MSDDGKVRETNDQTDCSANLDPRIGMRLEDLNKWTGKINALEKSFEEANSNFRLILSESTDRLKCLAIKLGKSVEESRPYYEAKERLIEVQGKCQRAAINYEKACQAYLEAKERINLAEKKFITTSSDEFDTTWQEMLNQANIKLTEAETMKKESERLHQQSMKDFHSAEAVVANLERKLKGSLLKSRIYFAEKRRFQEQLALVKEEIELTISQINCSKARYASTLRELEAISEEIHEKRACSLLKRLKREPGDGAEFKPGLISLDSCEIMINSQLAKLDLQINETLNCQHPIEPFQELSISQTPPPPTTTTDHPDDHSSMDNNINQASTSDVIINNNCPSSTESNASQSSDKEDKEDEEEDEMIYSDVNTGDDDDDADDEESPLVSSADENTKREAIKEIVLNMDKDKVEFHLEADDKPEEEEDEDSDQDDDEYEDVGDDLKMTSSQSSGSTHDQSNVSKVNGSLLNGSDNFK